MLKVKFISNQYSLLPVTASLLWQLLYFVILVNLVRLMNYTAKVFTYLSKN
nr:MAG TPA: hypothetical protein [Caudoviricetes sp.]